MSTVAENLEYLEERIRRACVRAGRPRESLRLMAVGKRQPVQRIRDALDLGLRLFGENRVQEMQGKREVFPEDAEVHLIGHLQRNKARDAAALFHAVQSIDAVRTVVALDERVGALNRTIPVLVEVNTSGEASKYGVENWDQLLEVALAVEGAPHLVLVGLMTLGPISENETRLRSAFSSLWSFRERLEGETGRVLPELSMGMSNDLEAAVLEGSTLLRVGTALFGTRQDQARG
jgi:PLP dependent protein